MAVALATRNGHMLVNFIPRGTSVCAEGLKQELGAVKIEVAVAPPDVTA
jgi:hypothetical protein